MGRVNNTPHTIMSSANSANIPSPTPSNLMVDMDVTEALPVPPQAKTPVVHRQDCLPIPSEIVVRSNEFSELSLSPRSTCAALEGHDSPS